MDDIMKGLLAGVIAAAFIVGASAQNKAPRDADRAPAELVLTPAPAPRDGQDRKDVEQDRRDADLAIVRDKCGDFAEAERERCIRNAIAERDRLYPGRYAPPARAVR